MKKEQKVTLLRRVRTAQGWRRRRVPTGSTRGWEQKLDRDPKAYGKDVLALGEYLVRRYERRNGKSKPVYDKAGNTYTGARAALAERADRLNYVEASERVGVEPSPEEVDAPPLMDLGAKPGAQPPGTRLGAFLRKRRAKGKITSEETVKAYELALREFMRVTGVHYAEQVTAETLLEYLDEMSKRDSQTRSCRYIAVGAVLRSADEGLNALLREHKPKVPKRGKVHYSQSEVEALLAYMRKHEKYGLALATEMFFKTGLRSQELAFLSWDRVDLKEGFIKEIDNREFRLRLRHTGEYVEKDIVFRTKPRRNRAIEIPIEEALLGRLREWRTSHPDTRFLFPTWNGNPDQTLLTKIRTTICHAGMNCGACKPCQTPCGKCRRCRCKKCPDCRARRKCRNARKGDQPCTRIECRKWKVHNLRHSFATTAIHEGIDPGTVRDMMGHADLRPTNEYLSAIEGNKARAKINRAFGKKKEKVNYDPSVVEALLAYMQNGDASAITEEAREKIRSLSAKK
jgi:integrase